MKKRKKNENKKKRKWKDCKEKIKFFNWFNGCYGGRFIYYFSRNWNMESGKD